MPPLLANEAVGANLKKTRSAVQDLAADHSIAIAQERKLNRDTAFGVQRLTR